jgi:hypothetical protein
MLFFFFLNRLFSLCPGLSIAESSYSCFPQSWNDKGIHSAQFLLVEIGISLTFCSDWLQVVIFSVSAAWVARIKDLSHHTWQNLVTGEWKLTEKVFKGKVLCHVRWSVLWVSQSLSWLMLSRWETTSSKVGAQGMLMEASWKVIKWPYLKKVSSEDNLTFDLRKDFKDILNQWNCQRLFSWIMGY